MSAPVYALETNINKSNRVRVLSNAFLRITPIDGLRVELSGAVNYYDVDGNTYNFTSANANWAQGEGMQSSGGHSTERVWNTLIQGLINYEIDP